MILSDIPYGTLKIDRLIEERMSAKENARKSDSELAWEFVNEERSRQANEAMHLLARLMGDEPSYMGASQN